MKELTLLPINIKRFMRYCTPTCHIDEDLVLTDFTELPLPGEARKMQCAFAAVCTGGEGRYTVDTVEHKVKPNDVIIVAVGQVLGDIKTSKDSGAVRCSSPTTICTPSSVRCAMSPTFSSCRASALW